MTRNLLLFVVLIYFASSPLHFYLLLILTMSYNHPDRLISFIIIYIIVYIIIYIIIYVINLFHVKLFIKGHNKISSQESACIFTIIEVLFIKIVFKEVISYNLVAADVLYTHISTHTYTQYLHTHIHTHSHTYL